jgi:putative transposase
MQLKSKNNKKYALSAHIVLTVKYRKSLLIEFGNFVKDCFRNISIIYNFEISEIEVDKNHIHILVKYQPKQSISKIIKSLKQISTYELYKSFGAKLQKIFWKKKIFWSSGYFISSIGEVNEKTISNYIKNHGVAKQLH